MAIKTQGTQLYFVRPGTLDVVSVGCITAIENVGAPIQPRDVTPVESEWESSEPGMFSLGQIDLEIRFDPATSGHTDVLQMYEGRVTANFAIGLGDGTDDPEIDAHGEFVGVYHRSFLAFRGWVMDVPFSVPLNENLPAAVSIMQVPSLVPGVLGVGFLPRGPESTYVLTTPPYPIEAVESMGSNFESIRVQPNYVLAESMGSSFASISGTLRDIFRGYDHPEPERMDSAFESISGELITKVIYSDYEHPPEKMNSSFESVTGEMNTILIIYDNYEPEAINSSFVSVTGSLS